MTWVVMEGVWALGPPNNFLKIIETQMLRLKCFRSVRLVWVPHTSLESIICIERFRKHGRPNLCTKMCICSIAHIFFRGWAIYTNRVRTRSCFREAPDLTPTLSERGHCSCFWWWLILEYYNWLCSVQKWPFTILV